MKKIIFGGERFPITSIRKIFKYLKKCKIYNVSGPTECTCMCSGHKETKKELFSNKDIFVGKINKYFDYKIDKKSKYKNIGELYLEGPAVSEGYINDKILTKKLFYNKKNFRGYKTGDIVKEYNNKNIKILGRTDNQVKFLGHRIELEEIEKKINEVFKLSDCIVKLANKKTYPFLFFFLITNKKTLTHGKIMKKLSERVPNYMIPEEVNYTKKFYYNINNKIDRNKYSK